MNYWKQEWLKHSTAIHVGYIGTQDNVNDPKPDPINQASELMVAKRTTMRAAAMGAAIAAIDGPVPIMDMVGLAVFVTAAGLAWWDVFDDSM
jgi:hypothetical protein